MFLSISRLLKIYGKKHFLVELESKKNFLHRVTDMAGVASENN